MEKLYDALRAATAPEPRAHAAAVEAAEHELRLGTIESKLTMVMWGVGINLTLTVAIPARLFT